MTFASRKKLLQNNNSRRMNHTKLSLIYVVNMAYIRTLVSQSILNKHTEYNN